MRGTYSFQYLETEEDILQDLDLMRTVFKDEQVDLILKNFIEHHPKMSLKNHFTIKHKDEIVASLCLIPQLWLIEDLSLKVAEMGCVATHPDHRRKGLQRMLNKAFQKKIYDEGYDIAVLAGIPYFYRQFGFEYAIPLDFETEINFKKLPSYSMDSEVRRFSDKDIPKAYNLLNESQEKFYTHSVRDLEIWEYQHKTQTYGGENYQAYSLLKNGELEGYIRIKPDEKSRRLILAEAPIANDPLGQTIIAFLKMIGEQNGLETLSCKLSHDTRFIHQLCKLGAIKNQPYAWQIRIVDLHRMFIKIKSILERRIRESRYKDLTEILNFNFRAFTIRVSVEEGKISDISKLTDCEDRTLGLNPYIFPQTLFGTRSRIELEASYPDFRIKESHKHLYDTLFPIKKSFIHYCY